MSGNLPNAPVNFLAYDQANDTLYAATDLGVFFMQNDDKVWTKLGDNLPNTATEDLKIQASSGKLYVGTFGRGTWRIPLGVTTQLVNAVNAAQKQLKAGDDICPNLSALEAQIASLVPRKITTAQQSQLDASIDAIRAELAC